MSLGVLVIGHGTRSAEGLAEFQQVVTQLSVTLAPSIAVRAGLLELARPTICEGYEALVGVGATRILALPVILFGAGHYKRDIPDALASASAHWPHSRWQLAEPFQVKPQLVQLSQSIVAKEFDEGIATWQETLLVVVGRGSQDDEATRAMHEYAAAVGGGLPGLGGLAVAFVALAEPRLPAVLRAAGQGPWRQVIVLPHLLFAGELLASVARAVADLEQKSGEKRVRLARHLGPDPVLVQVLSDRVMAAVNQPEWERSAC